MKQSIRFWISCGIALCSYLAISPTQALPVPDATLPNNSIVTNQGNTSTITGGTRAGNNLFHSFSEFSVPTNGIAHFNNALDIQNIISRVTGGSGSNIDGLLRANGTANLFLINPNGIIFGRNATLAIGGSFVGSTASSLNFADGTKFSATAQSTKPLLTVSVPIGLQFGGTEGSILNESQATDSNGNSVGLQVYPGKTLALVGGSVILDGGRLIAPGGRVELGGLSGAGTVGLKSDGSLSFPQGVQRPDVSLTNGSVVDVVAQDGGRIGINAQNINISGRSSLDAGIGEGLGSVASQAGDIELSAQGAINIANSSIFNNVESGAVGNGGNIDITAGSLEVTDGAILTASTAGQGNGGEITLNANTLEAVNGGRVLTSSSSSGNAGDIVLNVLNSVILSGSASGLRANTNANSTGFGGTISIDPIKLTLTSGASVAVNSLGKGNAGNLKIQAGTLTLDRGSFLSATTASTEGGNILLQAQNLLLLRHGSNISTTSGTAQAGGNSGNIIINSPSIVALPSENSDITANAYQGRGGSIKITSQLIFGFQSRQRDTPQSDIIASSQIGINGITDINPPLDLVVLPANLVDTAGLIAQSCPAYAQPQFKKITVTPSPNANLSARARNRNTGSERMEAAIDPVAALPEPSKFVVSGRGGIPPSPTQPLSSDSVLTNWNTLDHKTNHRSVKAHSSNRTSPPPTQIVEATGWVIGPKGEVILTAPAPTVTPDIPWLRSADCYKGNDG